MTVKRKIITLRYYLIDEPKLKVSVAGVETLVSLKDLGLSYTRGGSCRCDEETTERVGYEPVKLHLFTLHAFVDDWNFGVENDTKALKKLVQEFKDPTRSEGEYGYLLKTLPDETIIRFSCTRSTEGYYDTENSLEWLKLKASDIKTL
jgi:hypothetical protein